MLCMTAKIQQSGLQSGPPFWIWMLDKFRCYAHAQVKSL